jgi:nucleotide-binding universal stress UspA family protein
MSYQLKKILVPVDLSESSLNAFAVAVDLATRNKASLEIINVNEPIWDLQQNRKSHYRVDPNVLSALLGTLEKNSIPSKFTQVEGSVPEAVGSAAFDRKTDLIVMGMHGASGYREGYIGTNAYSVVKYSACPVLLIPVKFKLHEFRKILFPVLPIDEALNCYEVVRKLLDAGTAMEVFGLTSLKIERKSNKLDEIVAGIEAQLKKDKVEVNTTWANGGPISEEILRYVNYNSPDLVVLTSMIDAVFKFDFIGPHTQKILHSSRSPLLCIK